MFTRWRQGTSESGDKAQGSVVYAIAASPIVWNSVTKRQAVLRPESHSRVLLQNAETALTASAKADAARVPIMVG